MQVFSRFGRQPFGLAKLVYHLKRLFRRNSLREANPEAAVREDAIRRFNRARAAGLDSRTAAEVIGYARSTIYRWRRRYHGNIANLVSGSRRPKSVREKTKRTPELTARIIELREKHAWGKIRIAEKLRRDGVDVSASTVGRVLKVLLEKEDVTPIEAGKPGGGPKRKPQRKWGRRGLPEKPENPGDLVQLDTMFVGFSTGRRIAVLNAIDVVSRQAWSLAAAGATAASAKRLLEQVCASRRPKALQVDGGSEFRGVFEDACMELGIPLHVLPPRSPKLNGHVEAFNGTLRREFFNYFDLPDNVTELNPVLQEFMYEYHHVRPHTALGLRTPAEFLAEAA